MKIVHCCLSNTYNEGYNYQENQLSLQNKQDGHEVWILASTEIYKDNKGIGYTNPQSYTNDNGIPVIRVPYKKIINNTVTHKIRAYKGVYLILDRIKPDLILFHGIAAWEMKTVARYAKKNGIKLYIDNHASLANSAHGWFSKRGLHGIFYKSILKSVLPVAEKILCIGMGEYDLAKTIYKVPVGKLELWPLGGNIKDDKEYKQIRQEYRRKLKIYNDKIIFVHSGRINRDKKTCELLRAFSCVKDNRFVLLIAGEFIEDENKIEELIQRDPRICYLGWKSGNELLNLLTAADVYLQPGSMSVTMQNAMCCRCAMVVQPTEIYQYLLGETGIFVQTQGDLEKFLKDVSAGKIDVEKVKALHFERAKKFLDYRNIAKRIYDEPDSHNDHMLQESGKNNGGI